MSGDCYWITESEALKISSIQAKGLVLIPSLGGYINFSSVESVVSEDKIDKSNLSVGWLHDGTKVIKKYGNWVDAKNPEVNLDYSYYPELSKDEVLPYNPRETDKLVIEQPQPLQIEK